MRRESISVDAALTAGKKLPYALIRTLSGVTLGRTPEQVETGELLEARFFDGEQEVRIFERDGCLCAVRLAHEEGDKELEKTRDLLGTQFGGQVTISQILETDEDGQTYFAATRLAGWTEGKGEQQDG